MSFVDQIQVDFITNGQGEGTLAQAMLAGRYEVESQVGFEPGLLRPVIMPDGKRYCKIKTGRLVANKKGDASFNVNKAEGDQVPESKVIPTDRLVRNGIISPTVNASALPYRAWEKIDRAVIRASRNRLVAWDDLAMTNTYGGFDGMAVPSLIRDTITDAGDAKVDMDTLSDDFNDQPLVQPDILPLPIIHAGAFISQRNLAVSRNSGLPLDTTMIEQAGRRCAETLEAMTIGATDFSGLKTGSSTTFSNRGIYGFTTQPDLIAKTDLTTAASWATNGAENFFNEVLEMIELARAQNFYGPFILYYSTGWDQYMNRDYWVYKTTGGAAPAKTLRQRLKELPQIQDVKLLDNFAGTAEDVVLVQMTSETVRAVVGMEFTTVQWQEQAGAKNMLRVMGIKVPDLRSQYVGTSTTTRKCGIVKATTS